MADNAGVCFVRSLSSMAKMIWSNMAKIALLAGNAGSHAISLAVLITCFRQASVE